jgi:hypothetical protein
MAGYWFPVQGRKLTLHQLPFTNDHAPASHHQRLALLLLRDL